jgi:hypothetical protein
MNTDSRNGVDPLEGSAPRPSTFAERRAIAAVGALAILVAVGVLVRALGSGATPVSAADELAVARHRAADSPRSADNRSAAAPGHAPE